VQAWLVSHSRTPGIASRASRPSSRYAIRGIEGQRQNVEAGVHRVVAVAQGAVARHYSCRR
jgi:hypothetical protein